VCPFPQRIPILRGGTEKGAAEHDLRKDRYL